MDCPSSPPLELLNCSPAIPTTWAVFLPPNLPFLSLLELGKIRGRAHQNPNSYIQEEEEQEEEELAYLTGGAATKT
jgi:hypothetical protein